MGEWYSTKLCKFKKKQSLCVDYGEAQFLVKEVLLPAGSNVNIKSVLWVGDT
jgi:hypothetical protein